ncbi:MAG: tyrosine-type recombinase/integrase, partial [Parvibaculum sp.]
QAEGRRVGIPYGRTCYCPVEAIETWLEAGKIETGPLFRPITRHGHVSHAQLSGEAVSNLLRERLSAAGINANGYSGHSLRAGFATSAAQAGVSTLKIRAQTGHVSDQMLNRYVRDGELFVGNAVEALL